MFLRRFYFTVIYLSLLLAGLASSQTPEDDDIVKINTSLVQLDAVVTDQAGNPVSDLGKDDFEIWQDGKRKDIANFSFINTSAKNVEFNQNRESLTNLSSVPSRQRMNGTGRVITFIVDDGNCTSSLTGMDLARRGLTDFINEQMFATDLVAIYRTRSGSGLLQQYTSDKSTLLKVVKKIRWFPSLGCSNTGDFFLAARQHDSADKDGDKVNPDDLSGDGLTPDERNRQKMQATDDNNRDNQIVGTLGVLRYIVKGLDRVRGRKIVFLMSDGFPTLDEKGNSRQARDMLGKLTEEANRSGVVLNTIDVRGVFSPGMITAADDIKTTKDFGPDKSSTEDVTKARIEQFNDSQNGLAFLADETGGRFYRGSNNLAVHLERAMKIEKGYYLLGYEPDEETFKGTKFHTIQIKLKRPELKVYSRNGFLGTEDRVKNAGRSENGDLYDAIVAPLPEAGLDLRLTAFFVNTANQGNFVRSLVHIDGKKIGFAADKDGRVRAAFEVVAVTLNEKNEVVDEFTRTHTIRVEKQTVDFIRDHGLVYATDVSVRKPGVYNFRVAMKDVNSDLVGSASQVVEVPKLKSGEIYLSGLTIGVVDNNGRFVPPASKPPEKAISLAGSDGVPEIRTFSENSKLGYSWVLYNARTDRQTGEPKVLTSIKLYKDGKLISESIPKDAQFGLQSDWSRIKLKGYLVLNEETGPGDYALQLVAKDLVSGKLSSQWIDFEVVR